MERFNRQVLLFGQEGQAKIRAISVAIVGLGGLGSHIAQQLAYLGVGRFLLMDDDLVDLSNLNRLIGAAPSDAEDGLPKVVVAQKTIRSVDPGVQVDTIQGSVASPELCHQLRNVDFVFGCVDNDGPRLVLTTACGAFHKPYFDIATDIVLVEQSIHYGGRVVFAAGAGCPYCLDLLDPLEVERWMSSTEALAANERIYGKREAGSSPSVVSLNGLLASAACMEFMVEVVGLRSAEHLLEYDGTTAKLRVDKSVPMRWCPYCGSYKTGSTEYLDRLLLQLPGDGR